jgi:cytochrome c oxidase subunit 2
MAIVLALVLIAVCSVLFHFLSPWWWTPIASNWGYIDTTLIITFWITGTVFVAVVLFKANLLYSIPHGTAERPHYEPENKRLEWTLTIVTAVGVAAMLAPGLFVWRQFVTVPDEASDVEIIGQQWGWSFRLPGEDGRLGTSDVRHITAENPLGLNPHDTRAKDDIVVVSDDLHLVIEKPVRVLLRSIDVLHNFYVPVFRGKMDMVPGSVTYFWLTPTRTGTFDILCAELCGVGHPQMRGAVVVEDEASYQAWLGKQQTFAERSGKLKTMKADSTPDGNSAKN